MKRLALMILLMALVATFLISCGDDDDDDDDSASPQDDDDTTDDDDASDDDSVDDDDDDASDDDDDTADDDDDDTDPGDDLLPSAGFLSRQAEYLQYCSDNNGPGSGGTHGQTCRVKTGQTTYNRDKLDNSCTKINNREDTADFDLNSLLRMLYLNLETDAIPSDLKTQLEDTVLNFKYWLDEPGEDDLCWWSENHQILYHTAELLAGQLFPATVFPNSGMTGQDHIDHALPKLTRWLDLRGIIGFVEWHSNVYFNEDLPALNNLVDFAQDEKIAKKASMLMDLLAFDFANHYYKGIYATTHGRTYPSKFIGGSSDSTNEAAWLMLGIGDYSSSGNFAGTALATSDKYWPPVILEAIALDAEDSIETRERDSIDLEEGPDFGIGYDDFEDVMFWWGATGYAAPQVITGTFNLVDHHGMWDGWLWEDLAFLQFLVGSPFLETFSNFFEKMARGVTLEAVSTYTYRTPNYQFSGAQDFKKGYWAAQTHIWQATIDSDAVVLTTYPGGMSDDYMAGPWTGGWLPRATYHKNVGVIQYQRISIPVLESVLFVDYTHAYFPQFGFDEIRQPDAHWTLGKKGDAYVALYSANPVAWSTDPTSQDYELIADGRENVWIVELGSSDEFADFDAFETAVTTATLTVNGTAVDYDSPSVGQVEVGWDGPMTVAATDVDLGPFERWETPYGSQNFGDDRTILEFDGMKLDLDFDSDNPRRRFWESVK